MQDGDVELIDYLDVFWRRRWLVVLGTLACVLVAGLVTWMLPRVYRVVATIETGDAGERDVERIVARLNTVPAVRGGAVSDATKVVTVTAQFKRPVAIELAAETEAPGEAVPFLHAVAAKVVEELVAAVKAQREEDDAKLSAVHARAESMRREAGTVVSQLRGSLEQRLKSSASELDLTRGRIRRLRTELAQLQRDAQALERSLEELARARSGALAGAGDRIDALVLSQLGGETAAQAALLVDLRRRVTVELPDGLQELERAEQSLGETLEGLRTAVAALREPKVAGGDPREIEKLRETIFRVAEPAARNAGRLGSAMRMLTVEIPEELRALKDQADALERRAATVRAPRLLVAPEVPGAPIRPRLKANLAAGLVAGLVGSLLLALLVDYLAQARERQRARVATGSAGRGA